MGILILDKSLVEYPPAGGFIYSCRWGYKALQEMNIIPDILIGDLDSVSAQDLAWCKNLQVEIHQISKGKGSD